MISKALSLDDRKDSATTNTSRDDCYAGRERFPVRALGLSRVVQGRRTGAGISQYPLSTSRPLESKRIEFINYV